MLDPVVVAGSVDKIKVGYNLVLLTGVPCMVCMTCACHSAFGSETQTKNQNCC